MKNLIFSLIVVLFSLVAQAQTNVTVERERVHNYLIWVAPSEGLYYDIMADGEIVYTNWKFDVVDTDGTIYVHFPHYVGGGKRPKDYFVSVSGTGVWVAAEWVNGKK